MTKTAQMRDSVREDFDRIAELSVEGHDHRGEYQGYLLKHVPGRCVRRGCGRLICRRG